MVMTSELVSRFLFGTSMLVFWCYGRTVICLFVCLIALTRTNMFFRYTQRSIPKN